MAKIPFQDVVPPERRSIRDIPIPNIGKRRSPVVITPELPPVVASPHLKTDNISLNKTAFGEKNTLKISEITEKKNSDPYEYYYPKDDKKEILDSVYNDKPKKIKFLFGGIAIALIIIFIIGMMTVFASATITIIPKSEMIEVGKNLIATVEASPESVRYEVLKLSKSKTISVPATGEEAVEMKARGKIVVYNNFSSESQRLIIRTRFETSEGLIYRIPESIMVPGKSIKNGVEIPGSLEVEVFADEAGEKYNIKKTDFTIPGFKSDASRYKNFYARSSTEMMEGFVGKRKTVTASDKQVALQNVDTDTQILLEKDFQTKMPEELTLLSGSIIYESVELPQKEESGSVIIGKEITAYAILLNKEDLSNRITEEYVKGSPARADIKVFVQDFSLLNMIKKPAKVESGQRINLEISGQAQVLADLDTNLISEKLAGIPRKDTPKLMNEFAGISSITAAIRPVWKQSFPKNPTKISVKIAPVK